MNVSEAIRTRRDLGKVKPDAVPQEWIEQIVEAGTWAPNHKLTEPWKFLSCKERAVMCSATRLVTFRRQAAMIRVKRL